MRARWRIILVAWGLMLFAGQTWHNIYWNRFERGHDRYFWWGSIPLDRQPSKSLAAPCVVNSDCHGWEPESIWVTTGLVQKLLVLTAFPAFLAGLGVSGGLARLGVSKLLTFMIAMPLLISAWFYLLGWLLDRRRYKRTLKREENPT